MIEWLYKSNEVTIREFDFKNFRPFTTTNMPSVALRLEAMMLFDSIKPCSVDFP